MNHLHEDFQLCFSSFFCFWVSMSCISVGACRHDRETAWMNHLMNQVSSSTTCVQFFISSRRIPFGFNPRHNIISNLNSLCRLCKSALSLYCTLFA
ncbi:hypothetical protein Peur_059536 [Populus x canadensis]